MKLLFIQSDPFAWIGKMSVSAVLKQAGHDCGILIEPAEKDLMRSIKEANPEIIAFSATTGVHTWALEKAREIKRKFNIPILFGGPHATFFPEIIENKNIDFACIGEAEEAIVELLNALEEEKDTSKIKNIWSKTGEIIHKNPIRPLIQNLDELPFPDRSLYYKRYPFLKNQNSRDFIFMRGCPYQCSFCYNHSLQKMYKNNGKYIRFKNVDKAIEELLEVKQKWGLGSAYAF